MGIRSLPEDQQERLDQVLEILLAADLKVFQDLIKKGALLKNKTIVEKKHKKLSPKITAKTWIWT